MQKVRKTEGQQMPVGRRTSCAVGKLTDLGRLVFEKKKGERPGQEKKATHYFQCVLKTIVICEAPHQKRTQTSAQADADINRTHRQAALRPKPVRDQNLMWDRSGEQISSGVQKVKGEIQ